MFNDHFTGVEIRAEIIVDGRKLRCTTTIDAELWEHPDIRETVRQDLKAALVYQLLDHLDPAFTVRVV
jgi:hypothetical protein